MRLALCLTATCRQPSGRAAAKRSPYCQVTLKLNQTRPPLLWDNKGGAYYWSYIGLPASSLTSSPPLAIPPHMGRTGLTFGGGGEDYKGGGRGGLLASAKSENINFTRYPL